MELEISDLQNRRNYTLKATAVGGKVEIGHHPKADVRLEGPYVGDVLGAFQNDGSGRGWQFFNFNGRAITVVDHVATPEGMKQEVSQTWLGVGGAEAGGKGHFVLLKGRVVELHHRPEYLIKVRFEPDELAGAGDDFRRRDRQAAELVLSLHRELNKLMTGPGIVLDGGGESIAALEGRIEDLTRTRTEFPTDDMAQTEIGDHLAGGAIRAELVRRLGELAGGHVQRLRAADEFESWAELKRQDPGREKQLTELVADAIQGLELSHLDDLTARMAIVKEKFWSWWYDLLTGKHKTRGKHPPSTQARRYLALRRTRQEIKALWFGFGPLEDLLDDPTVTEIMVVDKNHIFVEKGSQIEDSGVRFLDDQTTLAVIEKVAAHAGRVLNQELPLLDAMMPDGSRVNAVHPSLALKGPALTIRRFPTKRVTIDDLVKKFGALSVPARNFLEAAVINRRNILVSGGTGTGKTTLLNCLSGFIPDKERIVTIEDTAELQLQKTHVVTLQTRKKISNDESSKEIDIRELVKNALRMRPDRIVVGECRGGEALDMLKAMNTGHDGSLTTLHANSTPDAILRLVSMCLEANKELPVSSINQMIAAAVDLVVQLRAVTTEVPGSGGGFIRRKMKLVSEISELEGIGSDGEVAIRPLFRREEDGPLRPTGALPSFLPDLLDDPRVRDIIRSPLDLVREPTKM